MKNIRDYVINFFTPQVAHKKCWQCEHFLKDKGRGLRGCSVNPHSFDNGWEYIPETYRANDSACGYFNLKKEIKNHLFLITKNTVDNNNGLVSSR